MGSYNYLGFAENEGACATAAQKTTYNLGLGACSPRHELGIVVIILLLSKMALLIFFFKQEQ